MSKRLKDTETRYTVNPCNVCAPLGSSLAVKGFENAMSILHGSQGCATYIRRYMISHFREPLDIASSSFDESSTIFGGKENLRLAIENVLARYKPELIAVSTTCLSETIGDDASSCCKEFSNQFDCELVHISTPSYSKSYGDGYFEAVRSIISQIEPGNQAGHEVNVFPPICSAADLRYFHRLFQSAGRTASIMPDYSRTLDGGNWGEYIPIAPGGTPLDHVRAATMARISVTFSPFLSDKVSPGSYLETTHGVRNFNLRPPVGVKATDALLEFLFQMEGEKVPPEYIHNRERVLDAYADCHKYIFGKRALVYGDADFTAGMCSFLDETGIVPEIAICGYKFPRFEEYVTSGIENTTPAFVSDDIDFDTIDEILYQYPVDLIIGNSKGYKLSKKTGIPFVRCGFPIHDRFGGPGILHVGYEGAYTLLERIVNTVLQKKQDDSDTGFSYL